MKNFTSIEKEIIAQKLIDFLTKDDTCLEENELEDCVDFLEEIKDKAARAKIIEDAYNLIAELQTAAENKDYMALVQTLTASDVQEWLDNAKTY